MASKAPWASVKLVCYHQQKTLCFHGVAMTPATVNLLPAIWGQTLFPRNTRWMAQREITVQQTPCISGHSTEEQGRERAHHQDAERPGSAWSLSLLWSSGHRGKYIRTMTQLDSSGWIVNKQMYIQIFQGKHFRGKYHFNKSAPCSLWRLWAFAVQDVFLVQKLRKCVKSYEELLGLFSQQLFLSCLICAI